MLRRLILIGLALASIAMMVVAVISLRVPRNHPDAVLRLALWQSRRTWLAVDVAFGHARVQLAESTSVDLSHGVWVAEPTPHQGLYVQWGDWIDRTRMSWIGFDLWIGVLLSGAYPLVVAVRRLIRGKRARSAATFSGTKPNGAENGRSAGHVVAFVAVVLFVPLVVGLIALRHASRTDIELLHDFIGAQGGVMFRQKIQLARAHSQIPNGHVHNLMPHENHESPRLGRTMDTPKAQVLSAVSVNAGADLQAVVGVPLTLSGSLGHQSAIDYWVADGDFATENKIVMYHEERGLSSVGPLRTSGGWLYGWPSDLIRVGDEVYGIETWFKQLYTLNTESGIVHPVGASNDFEHVTCLAYDAEADLFYGVDPPSKCLVAFDRATGFAACLRVLPLIDVLGAAYDEGARTLYLYSRRTRAIYALDPLEGDPSLVVEPHHGRPGYYDELQFFNSRLYGVFAYKVDATWYAQVRRIDLESGDTMDVGPAIANMSAHSLLINSMPEDVVWTVTSGPGAVTFTHADAPVTDAVFTAPGSYLLRLTVATTSGLLHDEVVVDVTADEAAVQSAQ